MMDEKKHTPGPWVISKGSHAYSDCFMVKGAKDSSRFVPICKVYPSNYGRNDGSVPVPHEANAHLLAAAPALLAACEAGVQVIEQLIPEPSARGVADVVLFQLRAAIRLATGAQP